MSHGACVVAYEVAIDEVPSSLTLQGAGIEYELAHDGTC